MRFYNNMPATLAKERKNLFGDLERLFYPSFGSTFSQKEQDSWGSINCQENDDFYKLSLDVPGIDPKTINIKIQSDSLIISTKEEKREHGKEHEAYRKRSLDTSIALPFTIDRNSIEANCENGVLELILPKKAQAKTVDVPVQINSTGRFMENIKKRFTKHQ